MKTVELKALPGDYVIIKDKEMGYNKQPVGLVQSIKIMKEIEYYVSFYAPRSKRVSHTKKYREDEIELFKRGK